MAIDEGVLAIELAAGRGTTDDTDHVPDKIVQLIDAFSASQATIIEAEIKYLHLIRSAGLKPRSPYVCTEDPVSAPLQVD